MRFAILARHTCKKCYLASNANFYQFSSYGTFAAMLMTAKSCFKTIINLIESTPNSSPHLNSYSITTKLKFYFSSDSHETLKVKLPSVPATLISPLLISNSIFLPENLSDSTYSAYDMNTGKNKR